MTSLPIRLSTNFHNLNIGLDLLRITKVVSKEHMQQVWHASRERTPLRAPGPITLLGLAYALILRPVLPNLPYHVSTFHLEYPTVLSRFCFIASWSVITYRQGVCSFLTQDSGTHFFLHYCRVWFHLWSLYLVHEWLQKSMITYWSKKSLTLTFWPMDQRETIGLLLGSSTLTPCTHLKYNKA